MENQVFCNNFFFTFNKHEENTAAIDTQRYNISFTVIAVIMRVRNGKGQEWLVDKRIVL